MPTDRPIAIVTGGARRVGCAIAEALAHAGCDLVVTCRRSVDEARALADRLASSAGSRVEIEQADLADPAATEALAQRLGERPRADILVHNASEYGPTTLAEADAPAAARYYQVNALAPLLLTRSLAPALGRSPRPGGGVVIAMTDIHAQGHPRVGFAPYAMSKAALAEMVRSLAVELAPRIRVCAVAPGVVAFPESGHESDEQAQRRYLQRVPLARAGTPEDAAEAVRWLAMDAAYCTGLTLQLDGGRSLA